MVPSSFPAGWEDSVYVKGHSSSLPGNSPGSLKYVPHPALCELQTCAYWTPHSRHF